MYRDFFGFEEEPFRLTPDPDFFYCSPIHDEAIEVIEYAIEHRKGFIMLSGEVGTGKTTICRVLLSKLVDVETSLVLNPLLSATEILKSIIADFGIQFDYNAGEGELYNILAEYFANIYKKGKNALIIVDEAQNLSFESFEMIRQISNIEMENVKLVQILLVGQTELPKKLSDHKYRQLAQRIAVSYELKKLNLLETENYVNFRLQRALKFNKYIFTKGAIKLLYNKSKGYPREINQIADHALLIASSKNNKKVSVNDIKQAYKSYKFTLKESNITFNFKWIIVSLLILLFIFGVFFYGNLFQKENIFSKSPKKYFELKKQINIAKEDNNKIKMTSNKKCLKLKTDVNFRFEPLLIDNVIKVLPIGSICEIMDNKSGWFNITVDGTNGWVKDNKKLYLLTSCEDK